MKSVYNFVVKPKGQRYNNSKKIGDKELIINTEIYNHQYVNREAIVTSTPIIGKSKIKPGDTVIVHHNVFRRWHDMHSVERNSNCYFDEDNYIVNKDQIFLYKANDNWLAPDGYCFIKPIKSKDKFNTGKEQPLIGVIKYTDGLFKKNDLVGFMPGSEYEFIIDGEKLYRVLSNFITIKYEYQGNEKEYNPSWT